MRWTIAAMVLGMAPAVAQAPSSSEAAGSGAAVVTANDAATAGHAACSGDDVAPKKPMILPGYGKGGFKVRTGSLQAQAFFDNGMQLAHAFAHKAAIQAFARAAELDPRCAMCLWGEAWASGPTINYPIDAGEVARLAGMAAHAAVLAEGGPEKERRLIAALGLRYQHGGGAGPGDRAFAHAMAALARDYPQDDEIATIAADAWMVPSAQTNSTANLDKAMALLEPVLKRDPDYTPAIHFYIHATESAGVAGRAEAYADRLTADAPAASHLVHMPSHTWYHVGRYQDAADANVHAVAIGIENAKRLGLPQPDGEWELPYHAHNVQYGVGGALMSGDGRSALALSAPLIVRVAAGKPEGAFPQMVAGTAYFAEARYADPRKVLALPRPGPKLGYAIGYWHYARGEAAARLGDVATIKAEAAAIPDHAGPEKAEDASAGAARLMQIAHAVLDGRAALMEHRPAQAAASFRKAARLEESKSFLIFSDPPAFWYPVRRDVGAALLASGRPGEALRELDRSLTLMPRDPIALALRADAAARLGQPAQARADRTQALALWHGDPAMLPLDRPVRLAMR